MPEPRDMKLYDKIKDRVYDEIKKHSAYRSSHLVKEYKEAYKKKYGDDSKPYIGKKNNNEGLNRWHREMWRNQRGGVGYKKEGDVYRPTKRVSSKTPKTFSELSKEDIMKAREEKKRTGRVKRFG